MNPERRKKFAKLNRLMDLKAIEIFSTISANLKRLNRVENNVDRIVMIVKTLASDIGRDSKSSLRHACLFARV